MACADRRPLGRNPRLAPKGDPAGHYDSNFRSKLSVREYVACKLLNYCSRLLSARDAVYSLSNEPLHPEQILRLQDMTTEGFQLRTALSLLQSVLIAWPTNSPTDIETLIAWTYFHAISIYLSGIYDYHPVWDSLGVSTPSLSQPLIEHHMSNILDLTTCALQASSLSGLLFLLPLRIAGARCWSKVQEQRIRTLLSQIETSFPAVNAFAGELEDLWANRESNHQIMVYEHGGT